MIGAALKGTNLTAKQSFLLQKPHFQKVPNAREATFCPQEMFSIAKWLRNFYSHQLALFTDLQIQSTLVISKSKGLSESIVNTADQTVHGCAVTNGLQ